MIKENFAELLSPASEVITTDLVLTEIGRKNIHEG